MDYLKMVSVSFAQHILLILVIIHKYMLWCQYYNFWEIINHVIVIPSICPDKQIFQRYFFYHLLIRQFKHVFWMLKRVISLKRFCGVPRITVLVVKKKDLFSNYAL